MVINLSVLERIVLAQVLPREGRATSLKQYRRLRESLSFTTEEHELFGLTFKDGQMFVQPQKIGEKAEFNFDKVQVDMIKETLERLEKSEKMKDELLDLYERVFDEKE